MKDRRSSHGELRCLLCGRCLANIERDAAHQLHLRQATGSAHPRVTVKVLRGKLHCARCGGRAFVEWDLMASIPMSAPAQTPAAA